MAPKLCHAEESAASLTAGEQVSQILRFRDGRPAYGTTMVSSVDGGLTPAPFSATMRT
jgi:hypothetical protein